MDGKGPGVQGLSWCSRMNWSFDNTVYDTEFNMLNLIGGHHMS
jgi:hypothetical protein